MLLTCKDNTTSSLHEVVVKVAGLSVLVASHSFLSLQLVVGVLLHPLVRLAFLSLYLLRSFLVLKLHPLLPVFSFLLGVFLRPEVREFLRTCLVQSIDDSVVPRRNKVSLDMGRSVMVERDLTRCHGTLLLQVRPWSVDYGDVVFLVPWN